MSRGGGGEERGRKLSTYTTVSGLFHSDPQLLTAVL
jgi:hypothetical protein